MGFAVIVNRRRSDHDMAVSGKRGDEDLLPCNEFNWLPVEDEADPTGSHRQDFISVMVVRRNGEPGWPNGPPVAELAGVLLQHADDDRVVSRNITDAHRCRLLWSRWPIQGDR